MTGRCPTNRAFNKRASINDPVHTQNSAGEWIRTPGAGSIRHSSVRCRIQPTGTREDNRLLGATVGSKFVVLMDAIEEDGTAVVVNHNDEIVIDSITYKAVGSPADQGGQGVVLIVPVSPTGADR